jgi:hypothetical protein
MKRPTRQILIRLMLALAGPSAGWSAAETVDTVVYARLGHGYQRAKAPDGSFQPEYYALSNGGLIAGTTSDNTIARVTYPEVAVIAERFLQTQNYHYARSKEQAKLLLVLNWGATLSYNSANYNHAVQALSKAARVLTEKKMYQSTSELETESVPGDAMVDELLMLRMENFARDAINLPNAKILGYLDAINEADGIQRWAGGGDRYTDLLTDIEEPRYYIVISAYDFPELEREGRKKLLWQVRVSVRSPGNAFDDSMVAMMKSASKYFGRDSGKLVRSEESKGTVELGDLKFMGEAKEPAKPSAKENK